MFDIGNLFSERSLDDFLRRVGAGGTIAVPSIERTSLERTQITARYCAGARQGQVVFAAAAIVRFRGDPAVFFVRPERPYRRVPLGSIVGNRLIVVIYRDTPVAVEVEAALLGEIERVERWLTRIEDEIRAAGSNVA
jgi:hypothetical protein